MKCLECNGTGKVECVGIQPDDWYTSKCEECMGTGEHIHEFINCDELCAEPIN